MSSEKAIPNLDTKFCFQNKRRCYSKIQAAIDYVSNLKPNKAGFRGAVLLDKGILKSMELYILRSPRSVAWKRKY